MDAYEIRFSAKLDDLLRTKSTELMALLVAAPAADHSAYMERVGRIRGIEWARETAKEVETSLRNPEVQGMKDTQAKYTYES